MTRSIAVLIALVAAGMAAGLVSAAAAFADCGAQFPEEEWVLVGETDLLTVSSAGLSDAAGLRFADEAGATARLLEADFGTLPPLELCVFGPDVRLDPEGLAPRGQQLHAVVFAEEGTIYVGGLQASLFDEAHSFGLAYATLWGLARRHGLDSYPEPLATVIGQWYMSRVAGKVDLHHSQMRSGAFFRDPSGGGVETTDWTADRQPPIYVWNPQFQESPVGDLIGFAVETHGPEVLLDTDSARWSEIEQEWQAALREEALQGSGSGNAWLIGLAVVVGFVSLAILLAWLNRRSRRKIKEKMRTEAQASL